MKDYTDMLNKPLTTSDSVQVSAKDAEDGRRFGAIMRLHVTQLIKR